MASDVAQVVGPVRVLPTIITTGASPEITVSPIGQVWDAYKRRWALTTEVDYVGTWEPTVAEADTWIHIARVYTTKLEIALDENISGAERTGSITIKGSGGQTATITINQSTENPVRFGISTSAVTLPAAGGEAQFTLTCKPSYRWRAELLSSWAWVKGITNPVEAAEGEDAVWDYKYEGMGKASLKITVPENTTGMERSVVAKFIQDIDVEKMVITQLAAEEESTDEESSTEESSTEESSTEESSVEESSAEESSTEESGAEG